MEFYQAISKYYDYIFPVGQAPLALMEREFSGKERILDLACGTGNYAIALAQKGYQVWGLDLDPSMIVQAQAKADHLQLPVEFVTADMQDCEKFFTPNFFGGVFCIGNSLVHLPHKSAVLALVKSVYKLLQEKGSFVIQIINYDRVLRYDVKELPTINNEQAGVKFIRKYRYDVAAQSIIFTATLEVQGREPVTNSVVLLPLLKDELVEYLKEAGFKQVEVFGDFQGNPFTLETQAAVFVASK